ALLADPALSRAGSQLTPATVVLGGITALPLVVRGRYPLGVLMLVSTGLLACLAVFHPNIAAVGIEMIAVYTVGLEGRRLRSLLVGAAMAPVVTAAVAITSTGGLEIGAAIARLALVLAALAAGDARRGRRDLLRAVAEEAQRERDAASRHHFDEERLRLAHELHDTVAHTLVAINVRAAAAAHRRRDEPGDGYEAFDEIKRSSADALAELRSTLKLLRPVADEAPLRPGPSLGDLQELVDGVSGAGLSAELRIGPFAAEVPSTVAHAGYRIVQESLTNVLRHSTARCAVVTVACHGPQLTVQIDDDGRSRSPHPAHPGHGLRGMAERAAALGGYCEAGAGPAGGWRVSAVLPLHEPTR
ncbi:MAG TPA: sensor histidine kinase, partial [Solirubrobacteraceae bacterium]|nr:sensor histidine kinase [Solirubrobacteraceae bacterium]